MEAETAAADEARELTGAEMGRLMREGVEALFVVWTALDAMREAQVAGWDTENAIEDMYEGILEQFVFEPKPKAKQSQLDLEDMIFDFTAHDLHTVLEDGSVEQVADYAGQLFRSLCRSDLSVYNKLMLAASKKRKSPPKKTVVIEEEEDVDDDEGEDASEGESGSEGNDNNAREGDNSDDSDNKADGEEGEDDDGWSVVGSAKKGSKAKNKGKNKAKR